MVHTRHTTPIATFLAALVGLAVLAVPGSPAGAETGKSYADVVDITFPTDPRATFIDDYDQPRSGGRVHRATDLMGTKHWPVYAAVGGVITFIPMEKPSYGYMISIAGDDGRKYSYVHLNDDTPGTSDASAGPEHAYAPGLERGSRVARGQLIGWLGDSGNAKGTVPHLHFEIEDPAVTDPYGTNRMNPYFSLKAAVQRGDFATGNSMRSARDIDQACPRGVPAHGFADVATGSAHDRSIACAVWWNVTRGAGDDRYAPRGDVNRAQMASFLTRLVTEAGGRLPEPDDRFWDVRGSVHADSVGRLAAAGIVRGDADGLYRPDQPVTRAQMATFLARTYQFTSGRVMDAGTDAFRDDDGSTHEANINKIAEAGFTAGSPDGRYLPDVAVTREQMASFLVRVIDKLVADGAAAARIVT
jgi:hypothetical protein